MATPWDIAIAKHLSSIPASQRDLLVTPASCEECFALIFAASARTKRAGFTRVLHALRPLVEPLRRFQSAIDVIAQTNAGLGSPIWGPIRFVVMIAGDHLKSVEKLALILERIVDLLPRVEAYELLLKESNTAQQAIGALYADFLEFCTMVIKYHGLPFYRFIRHDFNKQFSDIWEKIGYHSQQMDWTANATHIIEDGNHRRFEVSRYGDQLRMQIQSWLSPSNVQDDLANCKESLVPGSCDSIFSSPEYTAWESASTSACLRVLGYCGTGKTFLSCAVISRLETAGHPVAHFSCKKDDPERDLPVKVFRTLLSQILKSDAVGYRLIADHFLESGRPTADSMTVAQQCLNVILKWRTSPIFLVIDALDELRNRTLFTSAIKDLAGYAKPLVKILVTSRDELDIGKALDCFPVFRLTPVFTRKPIESYVSKRLGDCSTIASKSLESTTLTMINTRADGLWIFAKLMTDAVTELPTAAAIERQLQYLPRDMSEMYTQILERQAEILSPWQLRWAQQLFLWIDTEDYFWLCKSSISIAKVDMTALGVIFQSVNEGEEPLDVLATTKTLGGHMLSVGQRDSHQRSIVDYIHLSAHQFVSSASDLPSDTVPRILKLRKLRRLHRGLTALWYFEQSNDPLSLLCDMRRCPTEAPSMWRSSKYPLVVYGLWDAMSLSALPAELTEHEHATAKSICDRLTTFLTTDRCLVWIELAIIINYAGNWIQLLDNVYKVLWDLWSCKPSPHTFFRNYLQARWTFFRNYAAVLQATGPLAGYFEPLAQKEINLNDLKHPFLDNTTRESETEQTIKNLGQSYAWLTADYPT